jgi:transposase-like protein
MAIGRPSEYKPEWMLNKAIDLMSEGASKVEVAAELGITRETLYDWMKKHPEFSDTIKKGEQLCEAWWEKHGRRSLHDQKFNATLWYMNMKNRFKWSDRQEQTIDLTANVSTSQKIQEAEARVKKVEKEKG